MLGDVEDNITTIDFGNETTKFMMNQKQHSDSILSKDGDKYVFHNSSINNFDNWERLVSRIFHNVLRIEPECSLVYCCVNPSTSNTEKQKMMEYFFEAFNNPAVFLSESNIEILHSMGVDTGVVLDCGDGKTDVSSFLDGIVNKNYCSSLLTGSTVTEYLFELFKKEKITLENAKFLKENYLGFGTKEKEESVKLPDGKILSLNLDYQLTPEILFDGSIVSSNEPGVHDLIKNQIESNSTDSQRILWGNIIISGGSCNFKGFKKKLENTLCSNFMPNIVEPPNKFTSKIIGGNMMASMSSFQRWISKDEYDEQGSCITRRRKIF